VARQLRVYDAFPSMPGQPGAARYAALVTICVSERGQVTEANIDPGVPAPYARALREAILTWRYRPLAVAGMSRPFCHLLRVVYGA
jgi:hypothetical protein